MKFLAKRAGITIGRRKDAASLPLKPMPAPDTLFFPVSQHQGKPAIPVVKRGEDVRVGSVLAAADGPWSAPVHSSVSGKVKVIEPVLHPWGTWTPTIVVENDGLDRMADLPPGIADPTAVAPDEIKARIRDAGIVGMGGAMYPTVLKLETTKPIDTLIINGCECEPVLACDHRTMLERTDALVYGIQALKHALGAQKVIVAIEANKPDAIRLYRELGRVHGLFEVAEMPARYPFGAERVLIPAVTGQSVPSGQYPDAIGVVVQNVATVAAVCDALRDGMPLIRRPLTVAGGAVETPANLLVPLGTPVADVLAHAGLVDEPHELVLGGPMMGITIPSADIPVIKGTSGILARSAAEIHHYQASACLRCGRCVDACPAGLIPMQLARLGAHGRFDEAAQLNATDCMECGLCTYQCPADLPVTQMVRVAKQEVIKKRTQKEAAAREHPHPAVR